MTATRDIRTTTARRADLEAIGSTLAQAFQDDPVFGWVVPEPEGRRAKLPAVFRVFAGEFLLHGWSRLASDGVGVSLAAPAGVDPIAADVAESFGEQLAEALGGGRDAERAGELAALLEERHPVEPCAYLQFLGVLPDRHGQGVGSALLAELLGWCDEGGVPAYLEATSPDNRRLYERHGFGVTGEVSLPGGPPLWPMWREPQSVA